MQKVHLWHSSTEPINIHMNILPTPFKQSSLLSWNGQIQSLQTLPYTFMHTLHHVFFPTVLTLPVQLPILPLAHRPVMLCLQFRSCNLDLTGSFSSSSPGWHHCKGKVIRDSMSSLKVSTQAFRVWSAFHNLWEQFQQFWWPAADLFWLV